MKAIRIDLGNDTHALGVVFPDGYIYAHEPIADGYASEADLLAKCQENQTTLADTFADVKVTVLGAFVPVDEALRQLEQQAQAYVRQYNDELRMMQLNYERHMQCYDELKTMLEGYKQAAEASGVAQ